MNSLETMISRKIGEADPTLDLLGSDRKLLEIAHQDFTNYLKFIRHSGKAAVVDDSAEEKAELSSFLTVWISTWLKKWKNRVKLVFGNQSQEKSNETCESSLKAEQLLAKLEHRHEIIEILVSTLIRNAEICGTEILAEHLLKTELGKKNNQDDLNKGQVLAVLNDAMRKVREMAHTTGPLIFVRIDKGYYAQQARKEIPRL